MRLFSATAVVCASLLAAVSFVHAQSPEAVSYTHLTLPTNREV